MEGVREGVITFTCETETELDILCVRRSTLHGHVSMM